MKFRDIVVNLVSGAMPSGRVGYYIKRFAQEAAVRRVASLLLIGLFIFQSVVFIFPPQPSQAAPGDNDLIKGGIGNDATPEAQLKANLTTYLSGSYNGANTTYGSTFFRLMGINEDYVRDHMKKGRINAGEWKYSMGHSSFGTNCSTRFDQIPEFGGNPPFPGSSTVYVGSPIPCRWNLGYAPQGLIGDAPVQIGGQWWDIAVIDDCGNIVLRPGKPPAEQPVPPQNPFCVSVNLDKNNVPVGTPVTMTGVALAGGTNDPNTVVDMAYAAYKDNFTSVNDPAQRAPVSQAQPQISAGVQRNGFGSFVDPNPKVFTFTQPGTYAIALLVGVGTTILPGSLAGDCVKLVTVTAPAKILSCTQLEMQNSGATFLAPVTPNLKGTASVTGTGGTAFPGRFEYSLWHEAAGTEGNRISYGGTSYLEGNLAGTPTVISHPVTYPNNNATTFTDLPSGASFNADAFRQTTGGNFLIVLRVFDQAGQQIADNPTSCYQKFTVSAQNIPPKIVCSSLVVTLNPTDGKVPNKISYTAQAAHEGTGTLTPSKYTFRLYKVANNTSTLVGSPIVDTNTGFVDTRRDAVTLTEPGTYKATIVVTDQNNVSTTEGQDASGGTGCTANFTLTPQPVTKQCINLTSSANDPQTPPKEVTLTGNVNVANTKVTSYTFDFGDGTAKQKVDSDKTTQAVTHTYQSPGKYTASFTFETDSGTVVPVPPQCQVTVTMTDKKFTKVVANLTQLTNNGQPTNANNTTAKAGDKLRYQIGICNATGAVLKDYVFKDNISDLLYYTDVTDPGGAELSDVNGAKVLTWPATDVPALPSGQACVDDQGNIKAENFKTFKEFAVTVKSPVPATAKKPSDPNGYDCKVVDDFEGSFVSTPINCTPLKIVEEIPLPRTGGEWALIVLALFAASSAFLFFRNRMLKRELELVSTLTEGMYGQ